MHNDSSTNLIVLKINNYLVWNTGTYEYKFGIDGKMVFHKFNVSTVYVFLIIYLTRISILIQRSCVYRNLVTLSKIYTDIFDVD